MPVKKGTAGSVTLTSPVAMPQATTYLWNPQMMVQVNCRGFVTAQFMQPEPAKYSRGPAIEATTFMQPEQPYYAHHPGRFFFLKDEDSGKLYSAPYEPTRATPEVFEFISEKDAVRWVVQFDSIKMLISLTLTENQALELWQLQLINQCNVERRISLYPYFSVGYMSWMNQAARFQPHLNSIVCTSVTPYQKYSDHIKQRHYKDISYLASDCKPHAWETAQHKFEGEGGLHNPSAISGEQLSNSNADYEIPVAAMQHRCKLAPGQAKQIRWIFGAANSVDEIQAHRDQLLLGKNTFDQARKKYRRYIEQINACIEINTPDADLDHFVNHWLPRQIYYHGDINRLTTDPQTRNFLQDHMGMSYFDPAITKQALLTALQQQSSDGSMPDGILLNEDAELKYINQVPHSDHCVWLPICLQVYLSESNDYSLLKHSLRFSDSENACSVFDHVNMAMLWLAQKRDERGLSYIEQGDWCDPMNMVGHKGKGVSAWLTLASAYAFKVWANICERIGQQPIADRFMEHAKECNHAANAHFWDKQWYGRGITDDGRLFGIDSDDQGAIFLNPQAWAILSCAANQDQQKSLVTQVENQLETPYGVEILAPAFTHFHDDIGRLTQKHPGTAENGSVYNHAAAFYIYALYQINQQDRAYRLIKKMIPGHSESDYSKRGQLPVFIPNYYRGAHKTIPSAAGKSSQLVNTGTVHWLYRCLIEGLFGVIGDGDRLLIKPNLPLAWNEAKVIRRFQGARFHVSYIRDSSLNSVVTYLDGKKLPTNQIKPITPGADYRVSVSLP